MTNDYAILVYGMSCMTFGMNDEQNGFGWMITMLSNDIVMVDAIA